MPPSAAFRSVIMAAAMLGEATPFMYSLIFGATASTVSVALLPLPIGD